MYGTFCDKGKRVYVVAYTYQFMRTIIAKQMKNGSNV